MSVYYHPDNPNYTSAGTPIEAIVEEKLADREGRLNLPDSGTTDFVEGYTTINYNDGTTRRWEHIQPAEVDSSTGDPMDFSQYFDAKNP